MESERHLAGQLALQGKRGAGRGLAPQLVPFAHRQNPTTHLTRPSQLQPRHHHTRMHIPLAAGARHCSLTALRPPASTQPRDPAPLFALQRRLRRAAVVMRGWCTRS